MPRIKSKRTAARLTFEQEMDLLIGAFDAFETSEERRTAWFTHRDELLASVNKLARPAGFWDFEVPQKDGPDWPGGESEFEALERLGLLTPQEQATLREYREKWPQMYGFQRRQRSAAAGAADEAERSRPVEPALPSGEGGAGSRGVPHLQA